MRDKVLKTLAYWHAHHPWRMILVVLLLTLIFAFFAEQLKVTMRWSDLLPTGDKRTVQFNKIIDEFTSATSLVVVVQGEESHIKKFAEDLAPRILNAVDTSKNASLQKKIDKIRKKIDQLKTKEKNESKIAKLQSEIKTLQSQMNKKLFKRVDYKTEVDFLRNHGLMLLKEEDLKNTKDVFMDPNITGLLFNINNSMEKEYVGQEESISTREKEDNAVAFLDSIQNLVLKLQKATRGQNLSKEEVQAVADKLLFGEPYFLSYDKKALILTAVPNFTMMDLDLMVTGTDAVQGIIDDLLKNYPGVKAGLTGMIAVGRDEMVYSEKSLGYTTVIAVIAILILLMISFRMWVAPIFATFNLLVGLIWAVGTAAIVVGMLNIMTQMMAVILLGLGIDFSIHIISGFTERRAAGDNIAEAMEKTFLKSGKGILTAALTTACAFLTMVISHSRGMKEMGLVTGLGLLAILFATMLFLPSMLVLRERRIDKKREKKQDLKHAVQRDISFRFLGKTSELLSKHYIFTILASIIISFILIWSGSKISFDHNYMNLEPKGLTSVALQDTVQEKFDLSMDYALVLADSIEESRELSKKYRELGTVAITEDISLYLPSPEQQQKRIPLIREIREKIRSTPIKKSVLPSDFPVLRRELERLEMNIMEMQDMAYLGGQDKVENKCKEIVGDPENPNSRNIIREELQFLDENISTAAKGLSEFQQNFAPYFQASVIKMSSTQPIRLDDLPVTILDRYSNKKRDQFLVTVFPVGNIWQNAEFLNRFADDLERVSDRATGMPVVFRALIKIIGRDGRNAVLLTLVIVFLLLLVDYRNAGHALIAMIPLALGIFWMVGLMHLVGMKLSIMNVMGLPMIVGIGVDYGVHIIHRWRHEGRGKIRIVYSSTGKAILLTSLTTMLAFGSLVFSIWRGFGQLGGALFLGVGACFLTSVIILPGIIGIIERKNRETC
ncbi:MAG TPA: multidrug RND transporter [Candidatus Aminicenantes bacterium]|nr:multidrug RND transporter [Candidatus Aminicenantes bacterium]